MNKKAITIIVVCLAIIILFYARLITSGRDYFKVNESIEDENNEINTLYFVHWTEFPKKIISNFSNKKPGVIVEFERINAEIYSDAQKVRLSSGENLDIMGVMENDYKRFSKNGYLIELTEKNFLSNYTESSISQLKNIMPGGNIYCIPYKSWVIGVWYNKILFSKYNLDVPKNIDSFLDLCKKLKESGVTPLMLGFRDDSMSSYLYYLSILNAGDEDFQWSKKLSTGDVSWTDEKMFNSAKYIESIIKNGYISDDALNITYQQAFSEFLKGSSAMCITGDWYVESVDQNSDKFIDLGVFALPYNRANSEMRIPGSMTGYLTGIYSGSKDIDNAQLFLEYLSHPDTASIYVDETGTHTNIIGSYNVQKYDALWDDLRQKEFVTPISEYLNNNQISVLNKSLKDFIVGNKNITQLFNQFQQTFN